MIQLILHMIQLIQMILYLIQIRITVIESLSNRTVIVGPSFCGKTHLLLNKLQSIGLDNPKQQKK